MRNVVLDFVRRPASESPIVKRMVEDATTAEELGKVLAYAAKVDAFHRGGEIVVTELDYEGPDLSPGAVRPNSMKGVRRGVSQPLFDSDGKRIDGSKIAPLYPTYDQVRT
jgi:hypothetical protein